jgi:hypothetical protein
MAARYTVKAHSHNVSDFQISSVDQISDNYMASYVSGCLQLARQRASRSTSPRRPDTHASCSSRARPSTIHSRTPAASGRPALHSQNTSFKTLRATASMRPRTSGLQVSMSADVEPYAFDLPSLKEPFVLRISADSVAYRIRSQRALRSTSPPGPDTRASCSSRTRSVPSSSSGNCSGC